jgi:Transglycosylase SLT domain
MALNHLGESAIFSKKRPFMSASARPRRGEISQSIHARGVGRCRAHAIEGDGMRLILLSVLIVALSPAIILLDVSAVDAETKYHDSVPDMRQPTSSLEFNISTGGSDRDPAFALPVAPSDDPHHQGEQAAEPAQTLPPTNANLNVPPHTAHSVSDLCNTLYTSAEDNNLPVPFFANLIWQESELQLDSVSSAGALGIAQFMPEVAAEVGLLDPFDPDQALPASARFLRALRQQFGNLGFVAAAYNAGAHRVADWLDHDRALPQETKTYVLRVTGRSAEAWRKSPLPDSQLTFVRPLPCRRLPAFADLEQAQEARGQEAFEPAKPQLENIPPALARMVTVAKKIAQRVIKAIASKIAVETEKKTVASKIARKPENKTIASKIALRTEKVGQKTLKVAQVTESAAQKTEKKLSVARHVADEPRVAHSARNFRPGKHEPVRPAHAPHEKRKVA